MSVRKRTWTNADGPQEAWIVDYVDQKGKRHIKTFGKKKQADAHHATVTVDVRHGTHTADSESITVAEAGKKWIATAEENGLERSTVDEYRRHLDMHITPYLGRMRLSQLSSPMVRDFEDQLRQSEDNQRSPAMVKKIRGSLSMILADAQERGLVARNVVRDLRAHRPAGTSGGQSAGSVASSRLGSTFRRRTRSRPLSPGCTAGGGRCCSRRSSPAYGPRSFADCDGPTSISPSAKSTCFSGPTDTTTLADRNQNLASAPSPSRRRC